MPIVQVGSPSRWARGAIVVSILALGGVGLMPVQAADAAGGLTAPSEPVDFGPVPVGESIPQAITFQNNTGQALKVSAVVEPTPPFKATDLPAAGEEIKPTEMITVQVAFKSSEAGVFDGALAIATEGGGKAEVALAGTAEDHPEFRVFPESLEVGSVMVGETSARKIAAFLNAGGETLEVDSVHAPGAPFTATGLPDKGKKIVPGEEFLVEVAFNSSSAGAFHDSLSITASAGPDEVSDEVALSAVASAPAPTQSTPQLSVLVPVSTVVAEKPSSPPTPEPPPTLSHLQIRASTAGNAKHARKLAIAYTLSASGKVDLALERQTVSHRCPRHARSCVRWLATKLKSDAVAHSGHNSTTLSLASLAAGDYRLDATPLASSGAAGPTQRLAVKIAG